jgi:UDP-2,3-diacylglucosamine pyrophosphatase LpxH
VKQSTNIRQKDVFVVSDLHIGDRTSKDRFVRSGKDRDFMRFLEYVQNQEGQLVIAGDLFELWRFSLEQITHQWHDLLDLLHRMNSIFIPGNHDAVVANAHSGDLHPFFECVRPPFTTLLGNKRFRFMHGHEVDPLQPHYLQKWGHNLGLFSGLFDLKDTLLEWTNYALSDALYDLAETVLRFWHWLTQNKSHTIHNDLSLSNTYSENSSIRVQKMLSRFLYHKEETLYDVAIMGHTHKPGQFGQWYYNCGSWTRPVNNFLRIRPNGHTAVFDWGSNGCRPNDTLI